MENTVKQITVEKADFVKAVEFYCSSAYRKPESWMYFDGVFCMDFFHQDETPSHKDFDGYTEWLRLCGDLEDNDESFTNWLSSVKEWIESVALNSFTTEDGQDIEVTYI